MHHTPRRQWELRIANAVFVLLFLISVGLLQWLAREYSMRFDLTGTSRHTLSPASIAAAQRLQGPLTVTAYASQRGEVRGRIQTLVSRYQRYKSDLALVFVDPDESPDKVRNAGVRSDGELFFEYGDARERLAPPTRLDEEGFTNTLVRLGHRGERWVVFLSGHGERNPDRNANFDVSTWSNELRKRGFKTRVLSLAETSKIPTNTSVFVIAGPRTRLLPGELKEIQSYVDRGGNLLWLTDPGPQYGLDALAEKLGIEILPGTAIDPTSPAGNAMAIVVTSYGPHPIVRDTIDVTLFPQAGALHLTAPKGWRGETLLDTRDSVWLETSPLSDPIAFDKGKDQRGPLVLGVTLARSRENASAGMPAAADTARKAEQRIAVLADGDFISNSFIENGVNLDFGLSLINWLSLDDAYVNIPVRAARDRRLDLSQGVKLGFVIVFLFGLPIGFIGTGVAIWWRRRKR
jgi:ABC-type uncharacterized transport system involved in gliding motility auxiliary subunit